MNKKKLFIIAGLMGIARMLIGLLVGDFTQVYFGIIFPLDVFILYYIYKII